MPAALAQLCSRSKVDTRVISREKSLQLVKQLLATSISSITYLRSLFPEENYADEKVGGLSLKLLKRGYSQEADKLLDWLESGIHDALSRNYIRSIILGIHLDPLHRDRLAECYNFKFSTTDNGDPIMDIERSYNGRINVIGGARGVVNNQGRAMADVKKDVQQMLRRLILLTQTLKPLPDKSYITIKLFYTENTPKDYEPPFFRPATDAPEDQFAFECKPERVHVGNIKTGFHGLDLKIQTITDTFNIPDQKYIDNLSKDTCEDTNNGNELPLSAMILELSDSQSTCASFEGQKENKEKKSLLWNAEEDAVTEEVSYNENSNTISTVPLETQQPLHTSDSLFTSMRYTERMTSYNREVDKYGAMSIDLESAGKKTNQNSSNVPIISSSPNFSLKPSNTFQPSFINRCLSSNTSQTQISLCSSESNDTIGNLHNTKSKFNALSTNQNRDIEEMETSEKDVDLVCECICGTTTVDPEMIKCTVCATTSHFPCCGYFNSSDCRLRPDLFICYQCRYKQQADFPLLSEKERMLDLEAMGDLALFRRAVWVVWEEGWKKSARNLAERLGIKISDGRQLENRLRLEGFIAPSIVKTYSKRSPTKKFGKKGEQIASSTLEAVKNTDIERKRAKLFNPGYGLGFNEGLPDSSIYLKSSLIPAIRESETESLQTEFRKRLNVTQQLSSQASVFSDMATNDREEAKRRKVSISKETLAVL